MEPRRMAMRLHAKLTEDVAKRQREIVLDNLVLAEFGNDTLPAEGLLHNTTVMADGADAVRRLVADRRARLAEDIAVIRDLEALFKEAETADMKAFVDAVVQRRKGGK